MRRIVAGLSLRSNACPTKKTSLRACVAGVGFGGLIYQHIQAAICGYFERPTLRGLHLRRMVAGLSLRSNAYPTKRPSLRACGERMNFADWDRIAFRSRVYMWLMFSHLNSRFFPLILIHKYHVSIAHTKGSGLTLPNSPNYRVFSSTNNPIWVSLLVGQC